MDIKNHAPANLDFYPEAYQAKVLALLWLTRRGSGRASNGHDCGAPDRLYEKGMSDDPKSKPKPVWFTEEGLAESQRLFNTLFGKAAGGG